MCTYIYAHTHIANASGASLLLFLSQGNVFLLGPKKNNDQVQLPSHVKHLEQYTQVLVKAPVIHFTINILQ